MSIGSLKGPAEASHAAVFGGERGFLAFLAFWAFWFTQMHSNAFSR